MRNICESLTTLEQWYKVGYLVLVSEDHVARGQWSRVLVEAIHLGRDGLARSVTLRTAS